MIIAFAGFFKTLHAQIGLGITTPHPNAYFQVNSTTKGVLLPRMSALQRLAIAPAITANGLIVFDTDSSAYMFWTGAAWKKMGGDDGNWIKNGNDIYNSNSGRVGIGISSPMARLHVADSAVVFTAPVPPASTTVPPPVTGNGARMLWYPQKGAFRAGAIDDQDWPNDPTFWDRDNIGTYSAAFGQNNKAKGIGDFVAGLGNISDGGPSALFGMENQNVGILNFAAGGANHLNGDYNTALGLGNNTYGILASAIGSNNLVADSSIAIGNGNNTGLYSSISIGYYNRTEGVYNLAMGYDNTVKGIFSAVLGSQSLADGNNAISIGNANSVSGINAMAMGHQLIVNSDNLLAVGSYNESGGSVMKAFEVGIGTAIVRRNAFTITQNGYTGINTANPTTELDVYGNTSLNGNLILNGFFRYPVLAANNRVLVSDAVGNANWADASTVMSNYWTASGNSIYNNNPGNVGIGVNNPVSPLSFASSTGNKISLYGSDVNSHYGLGIQGSLLQIYAAGVGDDIGLGYGSSSSFTERMRIKGNGYVGIGNTDPAYTLDISGRMRIRSGGSNASSAGIWLNNNANSSSPGFVGMESDGAIGFYGDGTPNGWGVVMNIATGNVGIGTSSPSQKLHVIGNILATGTITPSDIRYKTNITAIQNPLSKLLAINGVNYLMNRAAYPEWQFDSTLQYGLIAQEVEKVFPEMVKIISKDGYKGIDYVKLVPVLVEAVKELHARNGKLEEENKQVKEQLLLMNEKIGSILNVVKLEK